MAIKSHKGHERTKQGIYLFIVFAGKKGWSAPTSLLLLLTNYNEGQYFSALFRLLRNTCAYYLGTYSY